MGLRHRDTEHPLFGLVEGEAIAPAIAGVTIDTKCGHVNLPRFGPPGGVTPYVLLFLYSRFYMLLTRCPGELLGDGSN